MKVKVGFDFNTYGTLEDTSKGIFIEGPQKDILKRIVRDMQGERSDKEFIKTLPDRMGGRGWAVSVDDDVNKAYANDSIYSINDETYAVSVDGIDDVEFIVKMDEFGDNIIVTVNDDPQAFEKSEANLVDVDSNLGEIILDIVYDELLNLLDD